MRLKIIFSRKAESKDAIPFFWWNLLRKKFDPCLGKSKFTNGKSNSDSNAQKWSDNLIGTIVVIPPSSDLAAAKLIFSGSASSARASITRLGNPACQSSTASFFRFAPFLRWRRTSLSDLHCSRVFYLSLLIEISEKLKMFVNRKFTVPGQNTLFDIYPGTRQNRPPADLGRFWNYFSRWTTPFLSF